jgi:hypothetical protein
LSTCVQGLVAKPPNEGTMSVQSLLNMTAASGESSQHHGAAASPQKPSTSPESNEFARELDRAMKKMMTEMHAPGYSGNPDVDFLVQ